MALNPDKLKGAGKDWLGLLRDLLAVQGSRERTALASIHPLIFGRVYCPEWLQYPPRHERSGQPMPYAEFQWEMTRAVMETNRVAIAAPRGFAKTTVMTKFLPMWKVLFTPHVKEVLMISASSDMASSWLGQMKVLLESSPEIEEDFGIVRGAHWGDQDLEIVVEQGGKRVPKFIKARGRGCQTRGLRSDLIVLDDIDNEETVNSEKMREDLWEWFWGALMGILNTDDKAIVCVGTAITREAVIAKLIADPRPGWTTLCYGALDDHGRSIWEAMHPTQRLLDKQAEIGVARFASEYLNAPIGKAGKAFNYKHIKLEEFDPVPHGPVSMAVDPATSGLGDPWAITVIEQSKHGVWYVHEAINDQTGLDRCIEAIFTLARLYQPKQIGVETSSFQQSLKYVLEDQSRRRGVHLPIVPIHNTNRKTKHMRIMELYPLFEAGRIVLKRTHGALRSEILDYPRGHDDLIDSLAMHLELQHAARPLVPPKEAPKGMTMEQIRNLGRVTPKKSRFDKFLVV